jgi:sialidase-1
MKSAMTTPICPIHPFNQGIDMTTKQLTAEHGIVCRLAGDSRGYFGWASVERLDNGKLLVGSSGLRAEHICPYGKTVLNTSIDDGATWTPPRVIHDSPLDDRDVGILDLGGGQVALIWASVNNRLQLEDAEIKEAFVDMVGQEEVDSWATTLAALTDEVAAPHLGSWLMLSADSGETWGNKVRVPLYTPHGPIKLRSGDLMYLGNRFETDRDECDNSGISAARSSDNGLTWTVVGEFPLFANTESKNYTEPHVVELPSGRLIGMARMEGDLGRAGVLPFSVVQSVSDDGGETWSYPTLLNFHGCPPHLLRHSSGTLIMSYGYRLVPFGQRIAISNDDGATWEHDFILRDDGPDWDLGYPSTVEMSDGSLFTVYYQKVPGDHRNSLHWSRWNLPDLPD